MAAIHPLGSESWLHVSRLGGDVISNTGLVHRFAHCNISLPSLEMTEDIAADTMGYAFTFPVVSLLGNIPVGAYVHYPTISTTMLSRVKSRTAGHTNSAAISSSPILSTGKLLYVALLHARRIVLTLS